MSIKIICFDIFISFLIYAQFTKWHCLGNILDKFYPRDEWCLIVKISFNFVNSLL